MSTGLKDIIELVLEYADKEEESNKEWKSNSGCREKWEVPTTIIYPLPTGNAQGD